MILMTAKKKAKMRIGWWIITSPDASLDRAPIMLNKCLMSHPDMLRKCVFLRVPPLLFKLKVRLRKLMRTRILKTNGITVVSKNRNYSCIWFYSLNSADIVAAGSFASVCCGGRESNHHLPDKSTYHLERQRRPDARA